MTRKTYCIKIDALFCDISKDVQVTETIFQRDPCLFFVGLTYSFEEITFEISFFSYIALKYFALRLFLKNVCVK